MTQTIHTPSRRRWLLGAGALAAVGGAALSWWRLQPRALTSDVGQTFWTQKFETVTGEVLDLATFRGKPLLVNFWATWCPPCVEELPLIDAFWREQHVNGFQVLALAIDQPSAVKRFLARQPLGFPIGLAGLGGTELAKSLGNSAGGLPFSVFFKSDGAIWLQKLGQLSPDDLSRWRSQGA
ncbi:redoxin [Limnohabitans sp. T6-5]|uniref:TlpA disulfide reductase family protein n=1 Tax=Limnohabitans sp. T6-5 TaxID=1100724 RepID=UPI000DD23FEF|nr:TlpA disulfide reductase family protein [Limnohabitans sp. T6-5]PUE11865.1 redoxin [Limnohabitans sp. T6-5]